ncbi:MAG TPA: hypothetical protein VGO93_01765 [Candidatus Xenobia bacterium]|jgi:hypothetical protein
MLRDRFVTFSGGNIDSLGALGESLDPGLRYKEDGALAFTSDKSAGRGPNWPGHLDTDLSAIAQAHAGEPRGAQALIRTMNPPHGLINDLLSGRLVKKGLAHDKTSKQWLVFSKTTHPLTEAGLEAKTILQSSYREALAELQHGRVDPSTRPARTWIGAWLLDAFGMLIRGLGPMPQGSGTVHSEGLRALEESGLLSPVLRRAVYAIAADEKTMVGDLMGAINLVVPTADPLNP